MKFSDSVGGIWEMLMCENMCVSVITLSLETLKWVLERTNLGLQELVLDFVRRKKTKKQNKKIKAN